MKTIAFSDTHSQHKSFQFPECDLLIFAGDCNGARKAGFIDFVNWYQTQPAKHKIFVPGNHDFFCENYPDEARLECKERDIIYLDHEAYEIDGIKFFGSPYTPQFFDWAFMKPREALGYYWQDIPEDTEILITHGLPYGILDKCPDSVGCEALLDRVKVVKPRYNIGGHIHEDGGKSKRIGKTTFLNVSVLDGKYRNNGTKIREFDI